MGCGSSSVKPSPATLDATSVVPDGAVAASQPPISAKVSINKQNVVPRMMKKETFMALQEKRTWNKRERRAGQGGMLPTLHAALLKLFDALDKDSDGELSTKEASTYLSALDSSFANADDAEQHRRIQAFISSFDADNDGSISLEEWKKKAQDDFYDPDADQEESELMQQRALIYTNRILEGIRNNS